VTLGSQFKKTPPQATVFKEKRQMQISLKNYQKPLSEIQKIITKTKQNLVETLNYQKVVMSWQIGEILEQHLLQNNRAEYGLEFFKQLEKDTAIPKRTLYQMQSFYKTYPTLPKPENKLNWSHYRTLSAVKNDETRKYLENLVVENDLGSNQLEKKIAKTNARKIKYAATKEPVKLSVTRGRVFSYPLTLGANEEKCVDLGFNIFSEIKTTIAVGEIVESKKSGEKISLKKLSLNSKQLHTYKAFLDRVVDGDTLKVTLDLGFKIQHKEILRLAKINAPEIYTPEGKKASDALKEILEGVKFLIVKTNKTDIYGRYVADIFFAENKIEPDLQKIADEGIYLSQLLLDRGLVEAV
jgi:hypothetical protein